ncbi:MAG: biotin--[acetyl-CoA-carboxylase] ligase [Ktedonobacterales bacterium]
MAGPDIGDKQEDPDPGVPLDVAVIEAATPELQLGKPLLYFPALGSTSAQVMSLAREGALPGLLVMTDEQTAGRGRIGRSWKSFPGKQLEFSLLLKPISSPQFLVMAGAVAVAETIEAVAGVPTGIKWPNDVLVRGRKVCGILIETTSDFVVLGIGLNVNGSLAADPSLAQRAITLADAAGHPISREALAIDLLRRLDLYYAALSTGGDQNDQDESAIWDSWRQRLVTLGHRVSVTQGSVSLSGVAEEVDAGGSLLLRLDDGRLETVSWGDVS